MHEAPFTRSDVRALLDSHGQRQLEALRAGRWNRVQNDLNDELAMFANKVAEQYGQAEAERFLRLYAEEQLAGMRDARDGGKMFEGAPVRTVATQPQQIAGPKASGKGFLWGVAVFLLVGLFLGLARR